MGSRLFNLLGGGLLLALGATASQNERGKWVHRKWAGADYSCKCYLGDACWPGKQQWDALNATLTGNLRVDVPPGAPCYNLFQGPLGNVTTYNAAQCANVTAGFGTEQYQIELPAAGLWTYFTNDTCRPTTNPSDTCTLGYYPVLVITATTVGHIQAGINFARENNLRLIIRNTGHDFLGRSVGWGSLVINTHSFQQISFTDSWSGAGGYAGSAITVGAGVQAFDALNKLNALTPPKVMVTGECGTVGIAGGLPQGGGHGPLTNQQGFLADTALEFKVITADGVLRTANEKTSSDLFWGLRGGGPATFAVIVEASYKTFADVPSTGITLNINIANTTLFWQAVTAFTGYSNRFVDNGIYVYYELGIGGQILNVQPIVGVGKTAAQLQAIVKPLFSELDALGVPYQTSTKTFATFYDLYMGLFATEGAGSSALTGGWTIGKADIANNTTGIVEAFKTVLANGSLMVGHIWNAGYGLPRSEWSKSAVNPRFRAASNKLITVIPVDGNAPLADKAAAQYKLTYVVDNALKQAAPSGAAYVNEADPFIPNWQEAFWGTNYPALLKLRKKWDPAGVFYAVSTPGTEDWEQIEYGTRLCKRL
ncbi:hypothetical protein B0T26DRAFT_847456 [Lasiosphaeria miniovina]|uniref:FAD-binding PCMH-type domain-containing protein n=1 Tax=Lasiosphaeria miniovina TaxID=1954250 RepID=A0AA40E7A9_9PEZI|nr:uncharacterized protein B0T26DRAFT_847456 [Lasiosphaeria miniovina]KAK0727702.1 hypothetical protein B0T26DRAFT_847456 [Lasiosphaeria miniovina]